MNSLMLLIVLLVNLGSSYLAGSGIHNLTRETPLMVNGADTLASLTGLFDMTTWHFLVSMAIAGALQLAITAFWSLRARAGSVMALAIGLALSLTSGWVSATFVVLSGEDLFLRHQSRMEAVAPARGALSVFSESLRATSLGLQLASETASALDSTERSAGGTCPDNTTAGPGPRQRMRARHAEALSAVSLDANAMADELLQLDFALQQASREELPAVFARAVALSHSPQLARLRQALEPIQRDLTVGWEDGGETYACPSPGFLTTIDDAISNLDRIVPIPSDLPLDEDPSTTDSGALLLASLRALIARETPPSDFALLALGLAMLVELFQISVISMREKRMHVLGLTKDAHDTFWGSGRGRRKRPHLRIVLNALERYTWFDGKIDFFAVPVAANDTTARLPVSYFGLSLHHPSLRNFEIEEIDPDWVAQRDLQGHKFDLYAMPKDLARWRRIADRDLNAQRTASI